jgi:hypothetical protein
MPVVHLRSLRPSGGDAQIDETLRGIARDVAEVLGGDPDGTWCTFTVVNRMSIGDRIVEHDGRIVYLDLWIRSRGDATDRAALEAACGAAARGLEVPIEDVWATLRLVEPDRVFAGGGVVEE